MKSKLTRIWGVGLVLVLMVTMLAWSMPVAADTLEWDTEDDPEDTDQLLEGSDLVDMAVAENGALTYVVTGDYTMWVSKDQGESWDDTTVIENPEDQPDTLLDADFVAVAPDDPKYVAVVGDEYDGDTTVYITEDAGATWDTLGPVGPGTLTPLDIAVSMESDDNRFVAVVGEDGGAAEVWYYEIGALGADWTEISDPAEIEGDGWQADDVAGAVAFSPNFNSDEILVTVTFCGTDNTVYLQPFSFNTEDWNDYIGGFDGYPVDINAEGGVVTGLLAADIAMSPDYLGSDDDLRQLFVGIADSGTTDASGIFFCDDDDSEALEYGTAIHSVDFDGTNLVAGAYDETTVYYSSDPLEGEDADVDNSSSTKSPGGEGETTARFCGDVVAAVTTGDDSSFAISRDLGENFNDINLIDCDLDSLLDFAISTDGSAQYLLSSDSDEEEDISLWTWNEDSELWERVRWFDDYDINYGDHWYNLFVRIAPDDPDVVYLAEFYSRSIFYSSDGGASKWHTRSCRYDIQDLAVETTGEVVYNLTLNGYVSKSINTGFTWGGKETTHQSGDWMITSLGEDLVLVGGGENGTPTVAYSTDGNESWVDLDEVDSGEGNVYVCAQGLAEGDWIFACTYGADENIISRLEIGEDEWEDDLGALPDDYDCTGIALSEGTLYVLSVNGTNDSLLTRFLDPVGDEDGDQSEARVDEAFDLFNALKVSSGSTNLWALDYYNADIYNYEDTIALDGPILKSPADGFDSPINEISGDPANVNLVWESQSDAVESFSVEVAYDADFDEVLSIPDDGDVGGGFDEGDVGNLQILGGTFTFDTTFYWRVKVSEPIESPWSETRQFTIAPAEAMPPVEITETPAPEITVEVPPSPEITLPAPVVEIPEEPAIPPALLWAVVAIGAILVIALIVLIYRTRKIT